MVIYNGISNNAILRFNMLVGFCVESYGGNMRARSEVDVAQILEALDLQHVLLLLT